METLNGTQVFESTASLFLRLLVDWLSNMFIYIYYYYYYFTAVPRKRGIATVMDRVIALAIMNNKKKANIA